jgi:hypothetical protein
MISTPPNRRFRLTGTLEAGATGSLDEIQDYETPWGLIDRAGLPIHSGTFGWSATNLL